MVISETGRVKNPWFNLYQVFILWVFFHRQGSVSRDQRRVWFADGVLPNGDAAESPKAPASSQPPSQCLAISNKSSASESSEVRQARKTRGHT